jgi:hypothetical protein
MFVWGVISLAFVLFAIISLTISTLRQEQQEQDDKYEKTFNDIRLSVVRKYDQTNNFLVSVTRANKPLISDYSLPIKEYDLDWLKITDASVIPVNENDYRIILYSAVYDCDQESAHHIWLLKLNKQMNLVEMIEMSDMHRIEGSEILIFGNRIISLPSFADFKYQHVIIPIEIRISDTIYTAPMLNRKAIDMMKSYFKNEVQKRKDMLAGPSGTAMVERYTKAAKKFDEAISERVIPY